jgi:hypothetical protein
MSCLVKEGSHNSTGRGSGTFQSIEKMERRMCTLERLTINDLELIIEKT